MKEIWKLIELLNEYEKTSFEEDTNWVYEWEEWEYYEPNNRIINGNWENEEILTQYELCSKQFWFIKWLVENDKIDLVKVYENLTNYEIEIRIRAVKELLENNEEDTIAYLKLLMLLAIQDEPIRFLCEIIK